ncbi:unnamed protein product [Closterium sp. Naga37s-1]|nr:unnamed protein product [Closterium sp. Naga37s-1]
MVPHCTVPKSVIPSALRQYWRLFCSVVPCCSPWQWQQQNPPPSPAPWLLLTHRTAFHRTVFLFLLLFLQVVWHFCPGLYTSLSRAALLAATNSQNRSSLHCTPMSAGGVACFSWHHSLHAAARAAVILRGTEEAVEVLQELTSAQPAALTSAQPAQEPAHVSAHEALKPSYPYSSAASQSALETQTSSPAAHHAISTTLHSPLLNSSYSALPAPASLFHPRYRRVLLLGSALFALQQFAGINAVVYFSSHIFRSAGFSSGIAASVLIASFKLAAVLLAARLVDSAGRKPLLLLSFLGMLFSFFLLFLSSSPSLPLSPFLTLPSSPPLPPSPFLSLPPSPSPPHPPSKSMNGDASGVLYVVPLSGPLLASPATPCATSLHYRHNHVR